MQMIAREERRREQRSELRLSLPRRVRVVAEGDRVGCLLCNAESPTRPAWRPATLPEDGEG